MNKLKKILTIFLIFLIIFPLIIDPILKLGKVLATTQNDPNATLEVKGPKITFTFDDGYADLIQVKEIFDKYGYKACAAIISDWVGKTDTNLTASEIKEINNSGWEILSHSKTHSSSWANITEEEAEQECKESKKYLEGLGINARGLALPYIYIPEDYKEIVAKYYDYAFGSPGTGLYSIARVNFGKKDINQIKQEIQDAIKNKKWLVYFAHYTENLSKNPQSGKWYKNPDIDLEVLEQTLAYIKSLNGQIEVVLPKDVIKTGEFNNTIGNTEDKKTPIVSFEPEGNTNYLEIQKTKVTVRDEEDNLDENSLKYLWKISTDPKPEEADFKNSFVNGSTISTNKNGKENILWILAKDTLGNTIITSSKEFYIDNEKPTVPEVLISSGVEFWTNQDVTVEIGGSQSISGIKKYQYSTNNGVTWNDYNTETKLTIKQEGVKQFIARAVSNSGITGIESNMYEIKIDKTNPTITGIKNNAIYSTSITPIISDESGNYGINSGIKKIYLTRNLVEVNNYKSGDVIEQKGDYKLVVTDNAGNENSIKFSIIETDEMTAQDIINDMGVGWNLGNSLDIRTSDATYETSINPATTKEMINEIKNKGFKSIRITASWDYHRDENYNIEKSYLERVKEVVDYGIDNGMYVILDIHHPQEETDGSSLLDPTEEKKEQGLVIIQKYWEQIATYFKDYDSKLIFETLNEPRKRDCTSGEWKIEWTGTKEYYDILNEYNAKAIQAIRNSGGNNNQRLILIPTYANSADTEPMEAISFDEDDKNIAVSIHAYMPNTFSFMDEDENSFSENVKQSVDSLFNRINESLVKKGIPTVITEFGVTSKVNEEERVKYVDYYMEKANELQISCFWWDNGKTESPKNDSFAIFDRKNRIWAYSNIADALVNNSINNENVEIFPNMIELNKTQLSMNIGDTEQLIATVSPRNATNKNVKWKSEDENIVRVSNEGKITAISKGKTQVSATTEEGEITTKCDVIVTEVDTDNIINVTFEPNGNSVYGTSQKTKVTIDSSQYIDSSRLKYVWLKNDIIPDERTFENEGVNFSNGREIEKFYGNGKYMLWIRIEREQGNFSYFNSNAFYIDTLRPWTPTVIANTNIGKWSNKNIELTVTGSFSESGIARYEYSYNNGATWQTYNDKVIIENEGKTNIKFRAVNNVGKEGNETQNIEIKIDKEQPVIKNVENEECYYTAVSPVVSDDLSGIANIKLIKDGEYITDYTSGNVIEDVGNYSIIAEDNAGNIKQVEFSIKEIPKIEAIVILSTYETTSDDVTATIIFKNNNIKITNNDGKNEYTFTENGEFTFEYIDEYGQKGSTKVAVNNINKQLDETDNKEEDKTNTGESDNKEEDKTNTSETDNKEEDKNNTDETDNKEDKNDNTVKINVDSNINNKIENIENNVDNVTPKILPNTGKQGLIKVAIVITIIIAIYIRRKIKKLNF